MRQCEWWRWAWCGTCMRPCTHKNNGYDKAHPEGVWFLRSNNCAEKYCPLGKFHYQNTVHGFGSIYKEEYLRAFDWEKEISKIGTRREKLLGAPWPLSSGPLFPLAETQAKSSEAIYIYDRYVRELAYFPCAEIEAGVEEMMDQQSLYYEWKKGLINQY